MIYLKLKEKIGMSNVLYYLDNLQFTAITYDALRYNGISSAQQLIDLYKSDKERLKKISFMGINCFNEIEKVLQNHLKKEGINEDDNSLTEEEQQLYEELTTLINEACYLGADEIIEKLDELLDKLLEDKK